MFTTPLWVTCHVSHLTCHLSPVICHTSHVLCCDSHVKKNLKRKYIYFLNVQSGVARWWRVWYQRGLPCLHLNRIDFKMERTRANHQWNCFNWYQSILISETLIPVQDTKSYILNNLITSFKLFFIGLDCYLIEVKDWNKLTMLNIPTTYFILYATPTFYFSRSYLFWNKINLN